MAALVDRGKMVISLWFQRFLGSGPYNSGKWIRNAFRRRKPYIFIIRGFEIRRISRFKCCDCAFFSHDFGLELYASYVCDALVAWVLNPRYVGPFKVLEKGRDVAFKFDLPEELSRVHNTFHVSNLKKCHADEPLAVPLDGLHFDDKLHFVKEPVEIMDREVKVLKQSRIPLVKVRWNSKRGPEFTWKREDQFRMKYPHLFARTASTSSVAS
nr:putative reverse transcriptase domain-containing protein [Tanacetum cinerariifolium]